MDKVTSENSGSLRDNWVVPTFQTIQGELWAYGKVFDLGLIPCKKVLDILLPPFLKLARKAIQVKGTRAEKVLEAFALDWCKAATTVISGVFVKDSLGVFRLHPVMRVQKRSELIKALLRANLMEVSCCI